MDMKRLHNPSALTWPPRKTKLDGLMLSSVFAAPKQLPVIKYAIVLTSMFRIDKLLTAIGGLWELSMFMVVAPQVNQALEVHLTRG